MDNLIGKRLDGRYSIESLSALAAWPMSTAAPI